MADPYAGQLTIFRVFSGSLKGDSFYNASKDNMEKFSQLLLMEGKDTVTVDSAIPGMIVAIAKLKDTSTGNTLCDQKSPVIYDGLEPIEPVMSFSVTTSKKDDEDKLFSSITRMLEEDPTLQFNMNKESKEMIISGMGQVHIEVALMKLKRKFGVEVDMHAPQIPYRETIKIEAKAQGKYKKQSGGRGQYGDCWIEIMSKPVGSGYNFVNKISGGVIPAKYIPAVEKGIIYYAETGFLHEMERFLEEVYIKKTKKLGDKNIDIYVSTGTGSAIIRE